jgi:hypothetical protein
LLNVYSNITTTQSDGPWELQLLYGLRVFKPAGIDSKVAYDCSVNPIVIQSDAAAAAAAPAAILSALQKFGAFLFKVVVSRSRTAYKDTVAYNPDGFIQHKIDHQTPLSALLYGMATGEENPVDKEMVRNPITDYLNQSNSSKSIARTYQSRFFAISAAHDLLLRSTANKPCHFQLMLGRQLQMVSLPRRIERLLSISKVSTCGGYNETSICRSAVKQMREKIELDPMGLHIILVNARVDKKTSLDYGRLNEFTISELAEEIEDIILTLNLDLEYDPPLPELRRTGMKKSDYVLKLKS